MLQWYLNVLERYMHALLALGEGKHLHGEIFEGDYFRPCVWSIKDQNGFNCISKHLQLSYAWELSGGIAISSSMKIHIILDMNCTVVLL